MIHKTAFMNINEHIEYTTRMAAVATSDKKQSMDKFLSELIYTQEIGKELFRKDQMILDILYTLTVNAIAENNIEHMFLTNQFMAFYTPEALTKLKLLQGKVKAINTFESYEGMVVLSYIRKKINYVIRYGEKNDDPRTDPIALYSSCIIVNKYINGPRLVF